MRWTVILLPLIPALTAAAAEGDVDARVENCVVRIIDEVDVPAETSGVLRRCDVREGLSVNKGQAVAWIDETSLQLQKRISQIEHQLAKERAENDAPIQTAKATARVAEAEHLEAVEINRDVADAIPQIQVRRLDLGRQKAEFQIDVEELGRRVNMLTRDLKSAELERVDHEISKHTITAPVGGVVAQRYHAPGEWLAEGAPVYRVIRMDRLRVEGFLNTAELAPQELLGARAVIDVRLTRDVVKRLEAVIDAVSPTVEPTGDYRVWCEFDNPRQGDTWVIRPGMNATMAITIDAAQRLRSAAEAPAP